MLDGGDQPGSVIVVEAEMIWRVDVENPNPGARPGQLHLQDHDGHKHQYNFQTGEFEGVPRSLARQLMKDPAIRRAVAKGLRYLME